MLKTFNQSSWFKFTFITLLIIPALLLWGELYTRMLLPQNVDSRMNIFKADPIVGFTYNPNDYTYEKGREYNALYQINSLGLRDREYEEKRKNQFRILLIGDSFSVSHGLEIEESLSRHLERELQKLLDEDDPSLQIQVINAAHGGYSPYNYWKAYERWAPVFQPDAVVLGISPDDYDCRNEYANYLIEEGETLAVFKEGEVPGESKVSLTRQMRKWMAGHSEFYILLRNFLYYNDFVGKISLKLTAKKEDNNSQIQQFLIPQPEDIRKEWEKSFSYFAKLKNDIDKDGIPLVLIPIPLKFEISEAEFIHTLEASGISTAQVDINQPLNQISAFCDAAGITMLDPRSALKKHTPTRPFYFVYDGHWISDGIQAATENIATQWKEQGLSPWSGDSQEE